MGATTAYYISPKGDKSSLEEQSTVWRVDSCTVEVGVVGHVFANLVNEAGKRAFFPIETTNRYTVPLGLVIKGAVEDHDNASDPDFVSGDRRSYTLTLFTQYKEIQRAISGNHPAIVPDVPDRTISIDEFSLSFNDQSIAERVKAAFLYASDLCRKKDKEPF